MPDLGNGHSEAPGIWNQNQRTNRQLAVRHLQLLDKTYSPGRNSLTPIVEADHDLSSEMSRHQALGVHNVGIKLDHQGVLDGGALDRREQ